MLERNRQEVGDPRVTYVQASLGWQVALRRVGDTFLYGSGTGIIDVCE